MYEHKSICLLHFVNLLPHEKSTFSKKGYALSLLFEEDAVKNEKCKNDLSFFGNFLCSTPFPTQGPETRLRVKHKQYFTFSATSPFLTLSNQHFIRWLTTPSYLLHKRETFEVERKRVLCDHIYGVPVAVIIVKREVFKWSRGKLLFPPLTSQIWEYLCAHRYPLSNFKWS